MGRDLFARGSTQLPQHQVTALGIDNGINPATATTYNSLLKFRGGKLLTMFGSSQPRLPSL